MKTNLGAPRERPEVRLGLERQNSPLQGNGPEDKWRVLHAPLSTADNLVYFVCCY